jgi:hypothetical protein
MGIHRKFSGTITRAAATASGSQAITLVGGKPILILFSAVSDTDATVSSDGWDDGSIVSSVYTNSLTLLATLLTVVSKTQTKSIEILTSGGDGHTANISSMDSDGFTLNWTKIGSGQAITVKYIAIL